MGMVDVPYLVHLENNLDPDAEEASNPQSRNYVDENCSALLPGTNDIVEDVITQSHVLSNFNWQELWRNKPFKHLVVQAIQLQL